MAYLINANLTGAYFLFSTLADANLSQANLTDADFIFTTLTGAEFKNAAISGANFHGTTGLGFTAAQFYSTASYQAHDLRAVRLEENDLSGWNFAGQNLTDARFGNLIPPNPMPFSYQFTKLKGADFSDANLTRTQFRNTNLTNADLVGATLTGANFMGADLRGAITQGFSTAIVTNMIRPDGIVNGVNPSEILVVRDYDGDPDRTPAPIGPIPIVIQQSFKMNSVDTLRFLFEADAWDSLISFQPGIPVTLGRRLDLQFETGVDVASQIGRTIRIFDWTGVSPVGQFEYVTSQYNWNLSRLYTTGEVTLIPEPSAALLAGVGAITLRLTRRRTRGRSLTVVYNRISFREKS
jgi:uncharacterized protein YjbI with pentapeptide repeats